MRARFRSLGRDIGRQIVQGVIRSMLQRRYGLRHIEFANDDDAPLEQQAPVTPNQGKTR